MKKIIFVSAFLFFGILSRAQPLLICSLNPSVSVSPYKGLNYVIDRYNQTRQGQNGAATLSRNMRNLNVLTGLGWRLGLNLPFTDAGGMFFALNRTGRRASTFAQVTDVNGKSLQRDLRFTANSLNLEAGYYYGGSDDGLMINFGGSLDLITLKAKTRLGTSDYKTVMDEFNVGISLFVQGDVYLNDNISVGLRPNYQYIPLTTSYADLNDAINPATAQYDTKEAASSKGNNFTLSLMLNLVLGE
jgi:hypothetical protein